MVDLYSYWMTAYFILYKLVEGKVPTWMSPYPTILLGFIAQLYIFYAGRHTLKLSFIVAVFLWKISLLLFTKFNFDLITILVNVALFCVYLAFIRIRGIEFKTLYTDEIYKTEKSHKTLVDFVKFRLNNIW